MVVVFPRQDDVEAEKGEAGLQSRFFNKKHQPYLAIFTSSVPFFCYSPSAEADFDRHAFPGTAVCFPRAQRACGFTPFVTGTHGLQCLQCMMRIRVIMSFLKGPSRNSESKQN